VKRSRRRNRNRRVVVRENPFGIGTAIMSGVGTIYAIGAAFSYFTSRAAQQQRVKEALLWPIAIFRVNR